MAKFNYSEIKYQYDPKESKYVDFKKPLKKARAINMIVSARNTGKTINAKKDLILANFFENGYSTMWLRRFQSQVEEELKIMTGATGEGAASRAGNAWFGDSVELFAQEYGMPTPDIGFEKGVFLINDKKVCEIHGLTEAINLKGVQRKGNSQVILDEFIEADYFRYISPAAKEPTNYFLKILSSVLRDRSIPQKLRRSFLLSNAEALANPYFDEFGMIDRIKPDTEWLIEKNITLWLPRMSKALEEELMQDPLLQVISNTSYAGVALKNSFFDSSTVGIEPKLLPRSNLLMELVVYNKKLGVYEQDDYIYVSDVVGQTKNRFVLFPKDIEDDNQRVIPYDRLKVLKRMIAQNDMRYNSLSTKALITDSIRVSAGAR